MNIRVKKVLLLALITVLSAFCTVSGEENTWIDGSGIKYQYPADLLPESPSGDDAPVSPASTEDVSQVEATTTIIWSRSIGGSDVDTIVDIRQTPDKGFIAVGQTWSNDGKISGNHGMSDVLVVMLRPDGTIRWQKCYGGSGQEMGYSIILTKDGNYLFAAVTSSNDGNVKNNHGSSDIWVVKINPKGRILWSRTFGGSEGDQYPFPGVPYNGPRIIEDTAGRYVLYGTTVSDDGNIGKNKGGGDHFVAQMNSKGKVIRKSVTGTRKDDVNGDIFQLPDGNYLVSGWVGECEVYYYPYYRVSCDYQPVCKKISQTGVQISSKTYAVSSYDSRADRIVPAWDGGFIISGRLYPDDGYTHVNYGYWDGWLAKIKPDTSLVWERCIGAGSFDGIYDIVPISGDAYICVGMTSSSGLPHYQGENDGWVARVSSNGVMKMSRCLGGPGTDGFNKIVKVNSDTYIAAGYSGKKGGDVTRNYGNNDAWIIKFAIT